MLKLRSVKKNLRHSSTLLNFFFLKCRKKPNLHLLEVGPAVTCTDIALCRLCTYNRTHHSTFPQPRINNTGCHSSQFTQISNTESPFSGAFA